MRRKRPELTDEQVREAHEAFKREWAKLAQRMRLMKERRSSGLVFKRIRRRAFHVRAYDVRSHDAWVWVRPR